MTDQREPTLEESVDALEEGDAPIEISAARAALRSRDFRVIWFGAMASNVGTWMQNVVLGAFALKLTGSPTFVGILAFAQLGPMLLLSMLSGALADMMDRRRLILIAQTEQLVASIGLAVVAAQPHPSKVALVVAVLCVGTGNAINAPAWSALLPSLVERQHLSGAIALNSTQMNGARVIGPAIGGILYSAFGAGTVFGINAATYLFAIVTVLMIKSPPFQRVTDGQSPVKRIAEGIAAVRADPVLRRVLVTIVVFSFFCLPFTGQMPTIAADNLHIDVKSLQYGLLYACFGIGAVVGALSIGTFLSRQDLGRITQLSLAGFSVVLLTYALLSDIGPAYPVVAMLGFVYFAAVTSLSTVLQERVDDRLRGRVLSLWQMGFGGVVPLGVLAAGPLAESISIRFVMVVGAVTAAGLAWYARVSRR
ncbi:MAG: arabinose efflux permease family protein [Actinomycetia bacterium]|nr:arabinose efflux permease family protein [Actinomycetes bacterium]